MHMPKIYNLCPEVHAHLDGSCISINVDVSSAEYWFDKSVVGTPSYPSFNGKVEWTISCIQS